MKILACDTALGALSVAVTDGDRTLAHEFVEMNRGHAEELAPMVARAMRTAAIAFADLDRLAVTTGPGTFTGQRVGLAFMRGAALALKIPLIGVTTLDAMAAQALAVGAEKWAVAVADAKRGEVYLGALDVSGAPMIEASIMSFESAVSCIAELANGFGAPVLAGTATEVVVAALAAQGVHARDSGVRQPDALWVAHLALAAPIPDAPPRPLYLRAPDARLPS